MTIYILFQKSSMGDGDKVYAISRKLATILMLMNEKKQKLIDEDTWEMEWEDEYSFTCCNEDGDLYGLVIEEHETV